MRRQRGFTFIELMVVVTIIVILITMAIPQYQKQVLRSREAVLKSDLFTMRISIQQFMYDKQVAPRTLDDLKTGGYLIEVPVDPITGSNTTWKTVPEDAASAVSQGDSGIGNVHSGSTKIALDGTHYSDW
jgi:general secretion pathway protein G